MCVNWMCNPGESAIPSAHLDRQGHSLSLSSQSKGSTSLPLLSFPLSDGRGLRQNEREERERGKRPAEESWLSSAADAEGSRETSYLSGVEIKVASKRASPLPPPSPKKSHLAKR